MTSFIFACFTMHILDHVTSKSIASFEDNRSRSTATVRYTDMLNWKERLSVIRLQTELTSLTHKRLWQEKEVTRVDRQVIEQSTFPKNGVNYGSLGTLSKQATNNKWHITRQMQRTQKTRR